MTTSGPGTTYRYVADGRLVSRLDRESVARLRRPGVLVTFVIAALVIGVGLSFAWSTAELPRQLGWVLVFGVAFGLVLILVGSIVVVAVSLPVAMVVNRRMARPYLAGSVTEVEIGDGSLTIRRSTGGHEVPYASIARVRPAGSLLRLELRGRLVAELLPIELLPDDEVEFIRTRARGAWPAESLPSVGTPTRHMVMPDGWASHVAAVHVRNAFPNARFLVSTSVAFVISALLAVVVGPESFMIVPIYVVLVVLTTYEQTRRHFAVTWPPGSVASTHVYDDRIVSRTASGVRDIRFDDIVQVRARGDLLFLHHAAGDSVTMMPRTLVPDDALAHLREHVLSRQEPAGG